jgi:hypothetical protein
MDEKDEKRIRNGDEMWFIGWERGSGSVGGTLPEVRAFGERLKRRQARGTECWCVVGITKTRRLGERDPRRSGERINDEGPERGCKEWNEGRGQVFECHHRPPR